MMFDLDLKPNLSWFLACFVPLIIFFLGVRQFLPLVGFIGAIDLGLEAIILLFMYRSFLSKRKRKPPVYIYPLGFIFIAGIIIEVVKFLS